jgi:hypothetical protein
MFGKHAHLSLTKQLFVLLALVAGGALLGIIFTLIGALPVWGMDVITGNSTLMFNHPGYLRFAQIVNMISMMLVPSIVYLVWFGNKAEKLMYRFAPGILMVISALIVLAGEPLIAFSAWINRSLSLPEWMSSKESEMNQLMFVLLDTRNTGILLINLFMIAVLPAFAEELLFRGAIQKKLLGGVMNHHMAILITAIIFSAIHFQFMTFLPRFFLGIVLGYMLVWGGSIWYPIIAHFTNNLFSLISFYTERYKNPEVNPFEVTETTPDFGLVGLSLLIVSVLIVFFYKKSKIQRQNLISIFD